MLFALSSMIHMGFVSGFLLTALGKEGHDISRKLVQKLAFFFAFLVGKLCYKESSTCSICAPSQLFTKFAISKFAKKLVLSHTVSMVEITRVGVVDMLDVLFVPKIVLQSQRKAHIVIIGVLIKRKIIFWWPTKQFLVVT